MRQSEVCIRAVVVRSELAAHGKSGSGASFDQSSRVDQASVALWPGAGSIIETNLLGCTGVCNPHSVLLKPDQRPARASSPGMYASRAMRAANTGIPAIVQRIVRQIVVMDVAPDFSGGPIGERVDFDQMKLRIPLHLERAGSGRCLVPTDAGHPGAQVRELSFAVARPS